MMLNGKELKHCTDQELKTAWSDAVNTPYDLADAIISEIVRRYAACSRYQLKGR
jgi:hypothetical protein